MGVNGHYLQHEGTLFKIKIKMMIIPLDGHFLSMAKLTFAYCGHNTKGIMYS